MSFFRRLIQITLSICIFVFFLLQIDFDLFWKTLMEFNPLFFCFGIIFFMCQIFFLNLRWHALINCGEKKLPFKTNVLINLASYFANIFFIASIGGVVAKSGLAVRYNVPLVQAVGATFIDRLMTFLALLFFCVLGVFFLKDILTHRLMMFLLFVLMFFCLGTSILILLLKMKLFKGIVRVIFQKKKFIEAVAIFLNQKGMLWRSYVCSLCAQAFFFIGIYILSLGFGGYSAQTVQFFSLLPVLAFVASLPISFGGWGVREGAFVYGLGLIGFSMNDAFLLSVQVGLASLMAPMCYTLPFLLDPDFSKFIKREKIAN